MCFSIKKNCTVRSRHVFKGENVLVIGVAPWTGACVVKSVRYIGELMIT